MAIDNLSMRQTESQEFHTKGPKRRLQLLITGFKYCEDNLKRLQLRAKKWFHLIVLIGWYVQTYKLEEFDGNVERKLPAMFLQNTMVYLEILKVVYQQYLFVFDVWWRIVAKHGSMRMEYIFGFSDFTSMFVKHFQSDGFRTNQVNSVLKNIHNPTDVNVADFIWKKSYELKKYHLILQLESRTLRFCYHKNVEYMFSIGIWILWRNSLRAIVGYFPADDCFRMSGASTK